MPKHLSLVTLALTLAVIAESAIAAEDTSLSPIKIPSPQGMANATQSGTSDTAAQLELYSGLDIASHGWFYGWVQATEAPFTSIDASAPRIRLFGEAGQYQYNSETFAGLANKERWYNTNFLIGYAFEQEHLEVQLYGGASFIDAALSSPDPRNPVQGGAIGPVVQGEFEYLFNHNMFSGEAIYTTAFSTYEAKLQFGRELAKTLYVGPELAIIGDERFTQWRIGAHVTAMNLGNMRIAISGGYENDSDTGPGAYGTIELGINF